MSPEDRLILFSNLSQLPPQVLSKLIFVLKPPAGTMYGEHAPTGDRVSALVNWAEGPTGCGLAELQELLGKLDLPDPRGSKQATGLDVYEGNQLTKKTRIILLMAPVLLVGVLLARADPLRWWKTLDTRLTEPKSTNNPEAEILDIKLSVLSTNNNPIENVEVLLVSNSASISKYTDSNGYVTFEIQYREDVEIILRKQGYKTTRQILSLKTDPSLSLVLFLERTNDNESTPQNSNGNGSPPNALVFPELAGVSEPELEPNYVNVEGREAAIDTNSIQWDENYLKVVIVSTEYEALVIYDCENYRSTEIETGDGVEEMKAVEDLVWNNRDSGFARAVCNTASKN